VDRAYPSQLQLLLSQRDRRDPPMSEVCSDCNGKKTYQGFNTKLEPCSRCHGTGRLDVTNNDALRDVFEKSKQLVECHDKVFLMPKIVLATPIHVYDAGWHTVFVLRDNNNVYEAGNKTETFYIPHGDVVFNMTQNRWECIRGGTPIWS